MAVDRKLLQRADVVLLLMWAFLGVLGYIMLLFSLSDYAIFIGLNQPQATACGRPFIGVLSDRFGRIGIADSATLLCEILVFIIWILGVNWVVWVSDSETYLKLTLILDHRSSLRGDCKA